MMTRVGIADAVRGFFSAATLALGLTFAGLWGPGCSALAQTTDPAPQAAGQMTDDEIISQAEFDIEKYLRENPLAPPDTSSPRAALESFLLLMNEADQVWRSTRAEFQDSGNRFLTDEQQQQLMIVRALFEKAKGIFDLSGIPETARERASLEIVLQFQEILDRIYLPQMANIPGKAAGSFLNSKAIAELPKRWKVPGTDIVFERTEVPGADSRYLITRATVDNIPEDYELIKSFPSRADTGDDLYAYYIYTPGNLIAPKWYSVIEAGPAWLGEQVFSQAYWQWIALGLLSLAAVLIPVLLFRRWRLRAVPLSEFRRRARGLLPPLVMIVIITLFRYLTEEQINITGDVMVAVGTIATAVTWTSFGWFVYRLIELLSVWIIKNPGSTANSLDSSLLLTGFRLVGLAAAVLIAGYGATQIGIPVYGVVAGLGVGGLAVALAAQPTLENLIGGIILYADRMVRVGEFCQFDDLAGTIETIGLRSTRIRALDRTIITVSNADLAKRKIINFSRRDQYHFRHMLTLRYETTEAQLREVIERIRTLLENHEMIAESPLRVRFVELGTYSLDVEVYAYALTSDRNVFLEFQEDMLLKFMEIVHSCGTDFAFPSSTTYLAQDTQEENPNAGLLAAAEGAEMSAKRSA